MIIDSKQTQPKKKTFFCQSLGPTVEVMAFYGSFDRTKAFLKLLSKKTGDYYESKKQDFFRECRPTCFSAKVEPMEPIHNLFESFVQKIMHVRDDLFIVQYMGALIEMRDFSSQEADPIYSFQIPHEEEEDQTLLQVVDLDFKGDETNIIIAFSDVKFGRLNLRTSEFSVSK